jgi:FkbM family methyltransferase
VINIREKIHTILTATAHPGLLRNYRKGIIPNTYCNLDQFWIRQLEIDTVLDIGANIGRFSVTSSAVFPNARIFGFEPLPHCFEQAKSLNANNKNVEILNYGLGKRDETIEINANSFSPSSSFLPMTDSHTEAFPFTKSQEKLQVQVRRLDNVAPKLKLGRNMMVKIDVQGYEGDVISGGSDTIKAAKLIMAELSYEVLYAGQPLFAEVAAMLSNLGFKFVGTCAQMPHPKDGRFLDADCLFVKA